MFRGCSDGCYALQDSTKVHTVIFLYYGMPRDMHPRKFTGNLEAYSRLTPTCSHGCTAQVSMGLAQVWSLFTVHS